ncbi:MAG TPA: dihydroorotate dehydrogenase [Acidimicrobiales bacterium]|nr:dihydroorotate dehydrogenase [Acidimicrobiales bacterium]
MRRGRRRRHGTGPVVDLSASVGPLLLPNPVMTAAGTAGHGAELGAYVDLSTLGAVVVKSLAAFAWAGNPPLRLCPVPGGMLNSVGLQGPGIAAWSRTELPALRAAGARVVVSIWGRRVEEFAEAAEAVADLPGGSAVALEANVSCPNLEDRSRMFAHSAPATAEVVSACRGALARCGLPLFVKLSPNTSELIEVAGAALEAGADGLTLVNTLLGLAIDLPGRRPALGGVGGGLSGPALHSVALRAVYECRRAFPEAGIIGVGGVSDGEGAARLLMAGADAVQVGTATLADPRAPARVLADLERCLAALGARSVAEIVGAACRPAPVTSDE